MGNDFTVHDAARVEFDAVQKNRLDPCLATAVSIALWTRLKDLVNDARSGTLSFEGANPDGRVILRHDCIYELRPRANKGRLQTRELRLYCGEPAQEELRILGLHLATKPSGSEDVLGEQDDAIDEAVRRATEWELSQARRTLFD